MGSTVFLLYGHPGVGKLTVAEALAAQLTAGGDPVRVVDNHWIANPIFGLVDQDGVTPLPDAVWDRVGEVADAVFRTLRDLTPPSWHLVFTAVLDGVRDAGYDDRVIELAAERGSAFIPVQLTCDPDENARRIVASERRAQMKSVDPAEPLRLAAFGDPYEVDHPNLLSLDITDSAPEEAATVIALHAVRCSS